MRVAMPTVMHTGNNTVFNRILKGYEWSTNYQTFISHDDRSVYLQHYSRLQDDVDLLEKVKDEYVIIPLRHPVRVLQSFVDRHREQITPCIPYEKDVYNAFCNQWRSMIYHVNNMYRIRFIHLDTYHRVSQTSLIMRELLLNHPVIFGALGEDTNTIFDSASMSVTGLHEFTVPREFIDFYEVTKRW